MIRSIEGTGTSEAEWRAWAGLEGMPLVDAGSLAPPDSRIVVCAPHPDDEILPCAAFLATAGDLGRSIVVIAVSNGEASHGIDPEMTPEALGRMRPAETAEALNRLGVTAEVPRLGLPDGRLQTFEALLEMEFSRRFRRGDVVITPWQLDGHPDHEAVTRAARVAAAIVGCTILETPIWGWHWSRPETTPMPWKTGVRFAVSDAVLQRKLAAIRAFESQLSPRGPDPAILTATTLERFTRPWEVYFR